MHSTQGRTQSQMDLGAHGSSHHSWRFLPGSVPRCRTPTPTPTPATCLGKIVMTSGLESNQFGAFTSCLGGELDGAKQVGIREAECAEDDYGS